MNFSVAKSDFSSNKIQAVIHYLSNSYEHMRMHLTHSKNIRNFEDVVRYLELEEDRLASVKVNA